VNAYEVKAGIGVIAGNTVYINTLAFTFIVCSYHLKMFIIHSFIFSLNIIS